MREILDTTKTKSQNSENVAGLRKRFELIKNKIGNDKKWKNKLGATRSFWASEPQGSRISILGTHSSLSLPLFLSLISLSLSLSYLYYSLSHPCVIHSLSSLDYSLSFSIISVLSTLSHLYIILSLSLSLILPSVFILKLPVLILCLH